MLIPRCDSIGLLGRQRLTDESASSVNTRPKNGFLCRLLVIASKTRRARFQHLGISLRLCVPTVTRTSQLLHSYRCLILLGLNFRMTYLVLARLFRWFSRGERICLEDGCGRGKL